MFQTWIKALKCIKHGWFASLCSAFDYSSLPRDAFRYLAFQRAIIRLLFVDSLICSAILIPILFFLGTIHEVNHLKSISLANLDSESVYIWIPISMAVLQLPLTLWTMRQYIQEVLCGKVPRDRALKSKRSLELTGLPSKMREKDGIVNWLASKYPWVQVPALSFLFE